MKTGLEHLERMEALLRKLANRADPLYCTPNLLATEAREIVAELDKGKDGSWPLAIEMTKGKIDLTPYADPTKHWAVKLAHEAIAKGRELERAERLAVEAKAAEFRMVGRDG